jgi:hypothetical protein
MSAIGTDRVCRPVRKHFRCWRLTGGAARMPVLFVTQSGKSLHPRNSDGFRFFRFPCFFENYLLRISFYFTSTSVTS